MKRKPEIEQVTFVAQEGDAPTWTVVVDPRCECWAVVDGELRYLGAMIDDGAGGFIPAEGDG